MDKNNWTYKKLGEVATLYDSQRKPVTKKDRKNGIYPYYGASGIQDYVDNYIFDGRYLLVGEDGAKWGANDKTAFIVEGKIWVNNHAHIMTFDDSVKDRFVEYYLVGKDLNEYITGAVVPKLTQASLSKIPIHIPPLAEQERIVAELDLLSSIIEKKKAQLKELDQLAQSIFYDMFGDPITNEKGWEVKKLSEISLGKLSYGSGASSIPFNDDVRYIRITDINDNGELNEDTVSPNVFDEKYLLNEGDILFARSGATVGKTYCHKNKYGKCIYAGYLIRLIPNKEIVNPLYVFGYTKTSYYMEFVKKAQNAVAQPNINAKQYGDLQICVPPLSLQQEFAEKVEAIERQKSLIQQSIVETQTLFDSRMDYWFG